MNQMGNEIPESAVSSTSTTVAIYLYVSFSSGITDMGKLMLSTKMAI